MEQIRFLKKLGFILLCLLIAGAVAGCRSKEKNPELLDPIYKDLQETLSGYSKTVEDTEKEIITLKKEVKILPPNTKDLALARKTLREATLRLRNARQMQKYLEIRVERRRVEDLKSYSIAFEKEEEWPKPSEYSAYLANKKLGSSKRQWDSRVPKLQNRLDSYFANKQKAAEAAAPSGH